MKTEGLHDPDGLQEVFVRLNDLGESVLILSQQVASIQVSIAQLEDTVTILDERQAVDLASAAEQRRDVADRRHISQTELAEIYVSFCEQELMSLASEAVKFYTSRSPRREWLARLIGTFCLNLFRKAPENDVSLLGLPRRSNDELLSYAEEILERARALHDRARSSGLPYQWDFHFRPGRRLDEKWQEPWSSCDGRRRAKFLVTPAYVVDGVIYNRQRVYTEREES